MESISVIKEYELSNGDTVKVTKLGRQYNFVRLFSEDQPPYIETGLKLDVACSKLITAMENDILEID